MHVTPGACAPLLPPPSRDRQFAVFFLRRAVEDMLRVGERALARPAALVATPSVIVAALGAADFAAPAAAVLVVSRGGGGGGHSSRRRGRINRSTAAAPGDTGGSLMPRPPRPESLGSSA